MMNKQFFDDVKTQNELIVITDVDGNVILKSSTSPMTALYRAYFRGKFLDLGKLNLYAYQVGLGVANIVDKIQVENCYAYQVSEPGLKMLQDLHINVEYEEIIPLVKSSKNQNEVCPIERFLFEHNDKDERWNFLVEKYANDVESPSCCLIHHKK